jgi:hypothetical protein
MVGHGHEHGREVEARVDAEGFRLRSGAYVTERLQGRLEQSLRLTIGRPAQGGETGVTTVADRRVRSLAPHGVVGQLLDPSPGVGLPEPLERIHQSPVKGAALIVEQTLYATSWVNE